MPNLAFLPVLAPSPHPEHPAQGGVFADMTQAELIAVATRQDKELRQLRPSKQRITELEQQVRRVLANKCMRARVRVRVWTRVCVCVCVCVRARALSAILD